MSQTIINECDKVTPMQQVQLYEPFNGEDVKRALFDIDDDKAPRPDGFTSYFFKKSWQLIGNDIMEVMLDFFPNR